MHKRTLVYLVQLVLLYGHGAHRIHVRLPKYVFIAKSCPHPNNINKWEKASHRLHCLHSPTSTDMGNAYHCLPTSFLNETVEFCGEGISVPPGHCPIYNYTDKADDKPGLYNCNAFISGCPTERFSSKDVRKFPSCLNINREHGCYEEESSCPKTSVTQVPKETTKDVNTVTISTSYVLTILITIGAALIGQMISLRYMCIYRCRYLQMKTATTRTDDETPIEMEDQNDSNITTTICDESCQREDLMDQECVQKMNTARLLNELSDTLKLQYNINFLDWIFEKCKDHQLVEKCQKFADGHIFNLECFQTNLLPRGQNQHLKFQLLMTELESHTSEVQNLRYWLAKSINVHPGQILMTAFQSKPIIVTFMMKEEDKKAFLEYIKTDDGQIAASQRKVEKVINETVINIEKALNGSNFINVRLRCETNAVHKLEENVRTLGSNIVKKTGVSLEGNEIHVRSVQSESEEKVARDNSSFKTFIQRNQNSLVENPEPRSIVTGSKISSLFDSQIMTKMGALKNRSERAKYFLEICLNLPKEEQETVITLLREIMVSSEEVPDAAESGPVRCWIQENQETLLNEIETDLIEITIKRLENVSLEVYTSLMDQSKGRKEKAKTFLEFVLRKDEYVFALQKTLKENGIECMKEEIA